MRTAATIRSRPGSSWLSNVSWLTTQSQLRVAALQCEQLMVRVKGTKLLTGLVQMDRLRALVGAVGDDVEKGDCSLIAGVTPQPFAHPFEARAKKSRG